MAVLHRFYSTVNSDFFPRILFSRIALEDINIFATLKICDGHDLPTSVNGKVNLQYFKGFIFVKLHIWEVLQE